MTRHRHRCLLLAACLGAALSGCPAEPTDPGPDAADASVAPDGGAAPDTGAADGGAGEPDGGDEDAGPGAPPIDEALGCRLAPTPARSVTPGEDLMRVTLDAPGAVCNDGSPGVFYVRPGSGEGADRWVVWLEGGGGCTSAGSCAARWCGSAIPSTAAKMSSRWAPMGIEGAGIFSQRPGDASGFADWNHVVLYYCSSDAWSGQAGEVVTRDPDGAVADYTLRFGGRAILDAALAALRAGATSDDGAASMPSLDDAAQILFAGTSAGGAGARLNADRVEADLRAANPDLDFRLVVDAGVVPRDVGEGVSQADLDAFYARSAEVALGFRGSDSDASCLAFNAADPSVCFDSTHVLEHHVGARAFVKMDVIDPVDSPSVYPDLAAFERAVRARMVSWIEGTFTPDEPSTPAPEVVMAPRCGNHVALETSSFYGLGLESAGVAWTYHDALLAWADGEDPPHLLDGYGGAASFCSGPPATGWPDVPGRHDVSATLAGATRQLHVVLPAGFRADQPSPMLIALHGAGGQARGFADGLAELRRLADARGWVLVFPQGLENASGATSWAWSDTPLTAEWGGAPPDDVAMLLALIQAARDELGVDPSRVHLAGFSKGGRMAQHFAALHPDRARALVVGSSSVGATLPGDPTVHRTAQPTGAVPALLSHGTADPLLPYAGDADVTPFSEQVERWRVANGCDPTPSSNTSGPVTVETFSGCAAPTRAVTVDGLTHRWSDGGAGFDMSATTFTFFDAL